MPQIIPIKNLKNTAEISDICHNSPDPIYITKNGYGDMVLMSMECYEKLLHRGKIYDDLAVSEQQISDGKVQDARESLQAMRAAYDL